MALPYFGRAFTGLTLLLGTALGAAAQTQTVGIGTTAPNPKAALDIAASDKGLLIPRLDSVQRTAISAPPDGLMVFQKDGRVGLWYAFGGQWLYIPDKVRAADNLGSHTATRALTLADNPLRLRAANDANHQLEYRNTWNGSAIDGPVLYGYAGGALGANTGGTLSTALRWNNGGLVGIGTAPATGIRLDVAGTTRTTTLQTSALQVTGGTPAAGRVLTSDATGTATWQNPAPAGLTNVTAPLTGNGVGTPLGIQTASASQAGALSAADWTTFNNKGTFTLPSLTSGSVVFSNGTTLAQNNANFFWDNATSRLGLGTNAPSQRLHVVGTARLEGGNPLQLGGTGTGSFTYMSFFPDGFAAARGAYLGFASAGSTNLRLHNEISGGNIDLLTSGMRLTVNSTLGNVGIGTPTPNPAAVLDIASTTKGFLPPRLTTLQRDAIAAPVEGLTIYNTSTDCLEAYTNGRWRNYCRDGNCDPAATAGSIVAGPSLSTCDTGDPPVLASATLPTGGVADWTYQWQQSTDNGVTWTRVDGATAPDYDPPTGSITTNSRFRRAEMNACGATFYSNTRPVFVYNGVPAQPGPITGPSATRLCNMVTGDTVSFFISATVPNATSYTWTYPTIGFVRLPPLGSSLRLRLRLTGARLNGTISVTANNLCGASTASTYALLMQPPTTPGAISTNPAAFCQGSSNVTFTVPAQISAQSYQWAYSGTGATVVAGASTNSITYNFSNTATNGTLSVYAVNGCGQSILPVTADLTMGVPAQPSTIAGLATVPNSTSLATYSVTRQLGVNYTWTLTPPSPAPSGAVTISNSSGASCTLRRNGNFGFGGAGTYTLTCTPSNPCGTGTARSITIVFQ